MTVTQPHALTLRMGKGAGAKARSWYPSCGQYLCGRYLCLGTVPHNAMMPCHPPQVYTAMSRHSVGQELNQKIERLLTETSASWLGTISPCVHRNLFPCSCFAACSSGVLLNISAFWCLSPTISFPTTLAHDLGRDYRKPGSCLGGRDAALVRTPCAMGGRTISPTLIFKHHFLSQGCFATTFPCWLARRCRPTYLARDRGPMPDRARMAIRARPTPFSTLAARLDPGNSRRLLLMTSPQPMVIAIGHEPLAPPPGPNF